MDVFDKELLAFLKSLNYSEVEYIIVGDIASNLHASTSFNNIIEVWVNQNSNSFKRLLIKLEKVYDVNSTREMIEGSALLQFTICKFLTVKLFDSVKGLEKYSFNYALEVASIADIFDIKVPFLHINQLIESKKAANRPKDQIDLIELEKIKKLREE